MPARTSCSTEAGGHAVISGATVRTSPAGPDGTWDLDELRAAFRDPTTTTSR